MKNNYSSEKCLVLGGGGVSGIAWMTGFLYGLECSGLDTHSFDKIVGTSAGSVVGAQILSDTPLSELYSRQIEPHKQVKELMPSINIFALFIKLLPALLSFKNKNLFKRKIGKMAMNTKTVNPNDRLDVIKQRLPNHSWPSRDFNIVVVNAENGETACFNKDSGVTIVEAVAASCAVPGIWPPVKIKETTYIDGGIRSLTNSDFSEGSQSILILAPIIKSDLAKQLEELRVNCSNIFVVSPNPQSKKAMGRNPLNPIYREHAAKSGYEQALIEAKEICAT